MSPSVDDRDLAGCCGFGLSFAFPSTHCQQSCAGSLSVVLASDGGWFSGVLLSSKVPGVVRNPVALTPGRGRAKPRTGRACAPPRSRIHRIAVAYGPVGVSRSSRTGTGGSQRQHLRNLGAWSGVGTQKRHACFPLPVGGVGGMASLPTSSAGLPAGHMSHPCNPVADPLGRGRASL